MGILEMIEQSGGLGSVARELGISDAFGSPDVSRTVAQHAAGRTGLDPALLKRMLPMLPMLAMLVAGMVSRHASAGVAPAGSGQAFGPSGGQAGLGSLLDLNGDGNPLDDILAMAGKLLR
jgi:hypothetical protein